MTKLGKKCDFLWFHAKCIQSKPFSLRLAGISLNLLYMVVKNLRFRNDYHGPIWLEKVIKMIFSYHQMAVIRLFLKFSIFRFKKFMYRGFGLNLFHSNTRSSFHVLEMYLQIKFSYQIPLKSQTMISNNFQDDLNLRSFQFN